MTPEERIGYEQVRDVVLKARHPLLISHKKPDGDTLGAMLGFARFLTAHGKPHTRFCVDAVPGPYQFMPGAEGVIHDASHVLRVQPDVVVLFDAGDMVFAGVDALVRDLAPEHIVNIDHHITNTRFGTLNVVVTDASSTAEVVHRFFQTVGQPVDRDTATCLLTGLCTDTSNFSNPATTASALSMGADLLSRGAQYTDVLRHIVKNKSVPMLKLWGIAFSRIRYNFTYNMATTVITQKDIEEAGVSDDTTEGISNFLNAVMDVPTVMVLKEGKDGTVRASLRTTGDRDVARLSAFFGGGGHKKAAGFAIRGRLAQTDGSWSVVI